MEWSIAVSEKYSWRTDIKFKSLGKCGIATQINIKESY